MKRGEVWTLQGEGYASKARPVVVVQSLLADFDSVIVCLFTTHPRPEVVTRVSIPVNKTNGLNTDSFVMTEKLLTVRKDELGERIGHLTAEQMEEIAQALAQLLAIGTAGKTK